MNACTFLVGFIVSTVLFLVAAKEKCEKCLLVGQCSFYGNLNAEEQERWVERFECSRSGQGSSDHIFGFSSRAKGDMVCCPDNIWGTHNQNSGLGKQNNFNENPRYNTQSNFSPQVESKNDFNRQDYVNNQAMNDYSSPLQSNDFGQGLNPDFHDTKLEPKRWNSRPQHRQGHNRRSDRLQNQGYNRNQNMGLDGNLFQNEHSNDMGFNGNQGFNRNDNPFFNNENAKIGATQQEGQCPLSSFPPNPESGCCGREAINANRITGSQYAPATRFPVPSRPNWMPRNNSPFTEAPWNSPWESMGVFENFRSRLKRDTKVNVTVDNRIAGGKETEFEQYPWTVLLKTTFDYGTRRSAFNCGGSIISSRYILTAAHCVVEENARVAEVEIYLAEYDKRTFPRDCKNVLGFGQKCVENIIMHAEDVIPHPKYDDNRLYNDIALIRLRGAAPYTDYIRPICLPPINIDNPDLFNLRLAVAGWGRNGRYKSDIKQSTVVNLIPNSECKEYYPGLTKAHLCAAGYSGEDTCKGDSGGPLMILYEGKYYVSGVVSGKRADAPCGTSVPSLYTNVYQFLGWIRSNIRN